MVINCPKCGSLSNVIKSGKLYGMQRYYCKSCKERYHRNPKKEILEQNKISAATLWEFGVSVKDLMSLFNKSKSVIYRWVNENKGLIGTQIAKEMNRFDMQRINSGSLSSDEHIFILHFNKREGVFKVGKL